MSVNRIRSSKAYLPVLTLVMAATILSSVTGSLIAQVLALRHQVSPSSAGNAPTADRLMADSWRADLRTYASMIRYLLQPEPVNAETNLGSR